MRLEAMPMSKTAVRVCIWALVSNLLGFVVGVQSTHEFSNQFAVHVPEGVDEAKKVASRHGFAFHGQIGDLENYYLFEHNHVHKRSAEPSQDHHEKLKSEPKVAWFEQQVNKKRTKRDYVKPDLDEMPWEAAGIIEETERAKRFNPGFQFGLTPQPSHAEFQRSVVSGSPSNSLYNFKDPFYGEQWYLHGGARGGYDMNVINCWKRGYSGKGVVISILDDGIQRDHPELALNYDPYASFDINDKDPDPMPQDNGDNKHGTRCAGEVSAVADNDVCGVGIAYNSSIGGVRMLDGPVNDAVEAHALSLNPDHIDIYSASWGPEDDGKTVDGPGPLARRAFINGIMKGRKGKGSIFVWASGNGGRHVDNCNCDGYTNSIFTLSISSATQRGLKPWYLEECASTLATTYSSGGPSSDKSVVTCDQDARLRPDRMCTVEHTGTSASAPIAAGICALALEANPSLTWRDMQYLVVMTSRPEPVLGERGWIVNGVKRKVSHKFGYGMMDADAMVALAEKWSTVPSQHICQSRPDRNQRTIPAKYGGKMEASMSLDACAGTLNEVRYLEHVQCKISLRYLPRGNLRILLTSPMGTTSTLLFERPRDVTNANFDEWPFLSVHFWGEKADGTWVLQIINAGERRVAHPGLLRSWQLILYGTDINPVSSVANVSGAVVSSGSAESAPLVHKSDCHEQCDGGCTAPGPSSCHRCKNVRFNKECLPSCPTGTFLNTDGECLACHETCSSCVGPDINQCVKCAAGKYYVVDVSLCVSVCPEGYLQDDEGKLCRACGPHCSSCEGSTNQCTSCEHHLVLHDSKCAPSCPEGLYETPEYTCKPCHQSCLTCNGKGRDQCITCPYPSKLWYGKCLAGCPDGFYASEELVQCVKCKNGCEKCVNGNSVCLACRKGFLPDKEGGCLPENADKCLKGTFPDGDKCSACHPSCLTCYGRKSNQCSSCPGGLVLQDSTCVEQCPSGHFLQGKDCFECSFGCTHCRSLKECLKCSDGLHTQDGFCRVACVKGFYSDRGECKPCHQSCAACSGPKASECVSCPPGTKMAGGACEASCPSGFFPAAPGTPGAADPGTCSKCHRSCLECKDSGLSDCTECPSNSTLRGGVCLPCAGSQFYDPDTRQCKSCHPTCQACNGPDELSCLTCVETLSLDPRKGRCVLCCSPDEPEESCCRCDSNGSCLNPEHRTRYVHDPVAEKSAMKANPEQKSSMTPSVGLVAIVFVIVAILGLGWVVFRRRNSTPKNKYTYHQLPVDSRTASGPEISDLRWSASGPEKVHIGNFESDEELERKEFVTT